MPNNAYVKLHDVLMYEIQLKDVFEVRITKGQEKR